MKDRLMEVIGFVGAGLVFCLLIIAGIAMTLLPFVLIGACIAVVVIVVRALTGI